MSTHAPPITAPPKEKLRSPALELHILPYAVRAVESLLNTGLWRTIAGTLTFNASKFSSLLSGSMKPTSANAGVTTLDPLVLDMSFKRDLMGLSVNLVIKELTGMAGAVFDVARTAVRVDSPDGGAPTDSCCVVIIPVSVPELVVALQLEHSLGPGVKRHALKVNLRDVTFQAHIHIPITSTCFGLGSTLDLVSSTMSITGVSRVGIVPLLQQQLCDALASGSMFSSLWSKALFSLCEQADHCLYAALNSALEGLGPVPLCSYSLFHIKPLGIGALPISSKGGGGVCRSVVRAVLCLNRSAWVTGLFHSLLVALCGVAVYMSRQCLQPFCATTWLIVSIFAATLSFASALVRCMLYASSHRGSPPTTALVPRPQERVPERVPERVDQMA
jgi:hypothetical protein